MATTRLRRMRISGDVYSARSSIVYNDAPGKGMETAEEQEAFVERAVEDGWRLVGGEHSREDWWEEYAKEVEAEEEAGGRYDVSRAYRVEPARLAADRRILRALPVAARYLGEGFGSDWVEHEGTVAVNGWMDSQMVTYVFEGPRLVARIQNPEPRTAQGLALVDGWLFLGMDGKGVMMFRRKERRWVYCGWLERPQEGAKASFGAGVAAHGEWLAVTGSEPAAVHFYRLRDGEWAWTESVRVDSFSGGRALAMGNGVAAAGEESRYGGSGCVEVMVHRDGKWRWEQTVALVDRRLDDGLGRKVGFEGESLAADSRRGWWQFPLRREERTG